MKRRLLSGFVVTAIFAFALISARTAAACRGALGCFPVNENCGVTCSLTGEDSDTAITTVILIVPPVRPTSVTTRWVWNLFPNGTAGINKGA